MSKENLNKLTKGDLALIKGAVKEVIEETVPYMITDAIVRTVPRMIDERLDKFAIMVKKGFDDIHERMVTKTEFYEFKGETELSFHYLRTDVRGLRTDVYNLQYDVTDLKNRMTGVESRLEGVGTKADAMLSVWHDHEMRIMHLEEDTIKALAA